MTAASATAATTHKSPLRRLLHSPWFWAALIGVITMPLIRPFMRHIPDPPPVLGQLPTFSLVDQRGEAFGSAQLEGQVYVVSFFSTPCGHTCRGRFQAMKKLQDRYTLNKVPVRLVSISVDPEHDDPRALRRHASTHGVNPARWTLLTGEAQGIRDVVLGGFRAAMGDRVKVGRGLKDIASADRFAIVDRQGGVRGFYRTNKPGLDEIYHRSLHVMKEER